MSFYYILGVETVDDLLERIDEAIEKAKIVIGNDKDKAAVSKNAAAPGADNAEKKPAADEPIRINYGEIHKIEDLIAAVNDKPGHQKIVLEGAPGQSNNVSVQKSGNPPPAAASPAATDENKDSSTTEKTTEEKTETPSSTTKAKTTETPSATKTEEKTETPNSTTKAEKTETPSSTTKAKTTETPSATKTEEKTETPSSTTKAKTTETPSATKTEEKTETPNSTTKAKTTETPSATKTEEKTETKTENPPSSNDTTSSEGDQIHVNIDNVQSVDELLDRIDDAVKKVPVVIDTKPRENKDKGLFIAI